MSNPNDDPTEYKEWLNNKIQILEESDVEFVHVTVRPLLSDNTEIHDTWHIDNLPNGVIVELIEDGEIQYDSSHYIIDRDIESIEDWLDNENHVLADDYTPSRKYDYSDELETELVALRI